MLVSVRSFVRPKKFRRLVADLSLFLLRKNLSVWLCFIINIARNLRLQDVTYFFIIIIIHLFLVGQRKKLTIVYT